MCMHELKWRGKVRVESSTLNANKNKVKTYTQAPLVSRKTECPWRRDTGDQKEGRGGRRGRYQRPPSFWVCSQWLLTLSMSAGNSVLSWPRLPLITLDSLRLYFFSSSIQRSSEHSRRRRRPPSWPISAQDPAPSPLTTTDTFPSTTASNSLLALDWLAGRPQFCGPFWVHSHLVSHNDLQHQSYSLAVPQIECSSVAMFVTITVSFEQGLHIIQC